MLRLGQGSRGRSSPSPALSLPLSLSLHEEAPRQWQPVGLGTECGHSCLDLLSLVGSGPVVPQAAGATLSRGRPLPGSCQPVTSGERTRTGPLSTPRHPGCLPPLLTARPAYSRVNGDKEVFDLRAQTTGHLQEHVPRLPWALPDGGASQEHARLLALTSPHEPQQGWTRPPTRLWFSVLIRVPYFSPQRENHSLPDLILSSIHVQEMAPSVPSGHHTVATNSRPNYRVASFTSSRDRGTGLLAGKTKPVPEAPTVRQAAPRHRGEKSLPRKGTARRLQPGCRCVGKDGASQTYHVLGLTDDAWVAASDVDRGVLARHPHRSPWSQR